MVRISALTAFALCLIPGLAAGDLDPPGSPDSTPLAGRTLITVVPGETLVIDQPGHYVLANSAVTDTDAIRISAEDVTLDLNGHTLRGNDVGTGVLVGVSLQGVRVMNGSLRNFNFGINVSSTGLTTVEDVELVTNVTGVVVFNSALTVIRDCDIVGNGTGVELLEGTRTTLENNRVAFSVEAGIRVDSLSEQTLIRGNEIHSNDDLLSIGLENDSTSSVILGNVAYDNEANYGGTFGVTLTVDSFGLSASTGPWANLDL